MNLHKPKQQGLSQINILTQYVQILKEYHAQLMIKMQKADKFNKSKYALELFEVSQKLDANIPALEKKTFDFHNNFLPDYTLELAECSARFDEVLKKAKTSVKKQIGETKENLELALKSYDELEQEEQDNIEIKNIIFKDIINLLHL